MGDRDAVLLRPRLLVIDEFAYARHNPDPEANTALFEVISRRYLKSSTILTSHAGIASWGERLADPMLAASLLDRLLHRGIAVAIDGPSYRMRPTSSAPSNCARRSTLPEERHDRLCAVRHHHAHTHRARITQAVLHRRVPQSGLARTTPHQRRPHRPTHRPRRLRRPDWVPRPRPHTRWTTSLPTLPTAARRHQRHHPRRRSHRPPTGGAIDHSQQR
jgi:hypothetical protein